MKIGNVQLDNEVFLSPMAGVTDTAKDDNIFGKLEYKLKTPCLVRE